MQAPQVRRMDRAQVDVAPDTLAHDGTLDLLPDGFGMGGPRQGAPLLENDEELGVTQGVPAGGVADEGRLAASQAACQDDTAQPISKCTDAMVHAGSADRRLK